MTVTTSLFNLQALDADIERLEQELNAIRRHQTRHPELETAEKRLAELQTRDNTASIRQRSLEGDLNAVELKIKRDQTRMYSGQIVDARELASLERELEHYALQRDELEGQVLESMELRETAHEQIASLSARIKTLRAAWDESRPSLERQAEEHTAEIARLTAERERVVSSVDERSIRAYTRLRASSGHAVAQLVHGVCGECRVAVPQKDIQHVHSGVLVTCPNCARILHASG
ncbi:MAG: hypothetical protein NVS2B16_02030 [Chloroflexota bacterium]